MEHSSRDSWFLQLLTEGFLQKWSEALSSRATLEALYFLFRLLPRDQSLSYCGEAR